MNSDEIKNAVQVAMTLIGGVLLSHGYVTSDEWTGLTGAFLAAVGPVWSIFVDHWNMKKVPENAKVVGGMILLAILIGLGSPASAANLSPPVYKAPAFVQSSCTVTSCTGFFAGFNIAQAGGNFDIVGTGLNGLAQNGLSLGGQVGYEFWNGSVYAAILADLDADAVLNGQSAIGVPTNFRDKLTYGVTARLGYSLASVFGSATTGTAAPTLPQQLLASLMTPYFDAGEVWRHGQAALRSGAGIEALVATNWTVNVDYYHYSYDQGGTAGNVGGIAPITQTNDNEIRLSLNRHFGF